MLMIIYLMIQLKYLNRFWSLIDLGLIICSWFCLGIEMLNANQSDRIGSLFEQTNG